MIGLEVFHHFFNKLTFTSRYIVQNEGARGLFKGLGPNLVGVAPSR
jgi:hypothetical protein